MSWFFIALIGPLLYAMTNYIDKILLEKVFKEGGVGTILLFSSLVSVFALPFIFLMDRTAFSVGVLQILILAVVGVLNALVLWFYLIALEDEEASIVVVFYQLVPVMGSILGYFIIGETFGPNETPRKVRMYCTCGLQRRFTLMYGPSFHLIGSHCKECY